MNLRIDLALKAAAKRVEVQEHCTGLSRVASPAACPQARGDGRGRRTGSRQGHR